MKIGRWPLSRPDTPQHVAGPLHQWPNGDDPRPIVLVTLLCATPARRDRALRFHGRHRTHRAVFVVTDPDLAPFRHAGVPAEHMPHPEMVRRHSDRGDWPGYLRQRWTILRAKWSPDLAVTEGMELAEYLRECGFSDTID